VGEYCQRKENNVKEKKNLLLKEQAKLLEEYHRNNFLQVIGYLLQSFISKEEQIMTI
jgi:hypothetical protein